MSPLQQEPEHPMGNVYFPLGSSPPESWERESDEMFALREEIMKTYI